MMLEPYIIPLSSKGNILSNPTVGRQEAIPATYNAIYFGEKSKLKLFSWQYTSIPPWTETVKPPKDYGIDNFTIIENEIDVVTIYCDSVSWNDSGIENLSYTELLALLKTRDTSGNGSKEYPFKNLSYALSKIACLRNSYAVCPGCMPTIHLCVSGTVDYSAMIYPSDWGSTEEFNYGSVSRNGAQFDFGGKLIIDGGGNLELIWNREIPLFNVDNVRFYNMSIESHIQSARINQGYYDSESKVFEFYNVTMYTANCSRAFINVNGCLECTFIDVTKDSTGTYTFFAEALAKCSFNGVSPNTGILFDAEAIELRQSAIARIVLKSTLAFAITYIDYAGRITYMVDDYYEGDIISGTCADVSVRIVRTRGTTSLGGIHTANCTNCKVELIDDFTDGCDTGRAMYGISAEYQCIACDIMVQSVSSRSIYGIDTFGYNDHTPTVRWNVVNINGSLDYSTACTVTGIDSDGVVANNSVYIDVYPGDKCGIENDNTALNDYNAYGYKTEAGSLLYDNTSEILLGDGKTQRLLIAKGFFVDNHSHEDVKTQIINCSSYIDIRGACACHGKSFDAHFIESVDIINSVGNDVCSNGDESCWVKLDC